MKIERVLIGTTNKRKLEEYKYFLKEMFGIEGVSMEEMSIQDPKTEEVSKFYEVNAFDKCCALSKLVPDMVILTDDSGLEIESLNGYPGIFSHRFKPELTMEKKMEYLVESTHGERKATMFSGMCLYLPNEGYHTCLENTTGTIVTEIPEVPVKFSYNPIFVPDGWDCVLAQKDIKEHVGIVPRTKCLKRLLG